MTDKNLNILITGGSSGLGEAIIANMFKSHLENQIWNELNINIYNIDLQESKYSLNEKCGKFNVYDIKFDLSEGLEFKFKQMVDILPEKIDILINNCGVNYLEWIENIDFDQYEALMNINVKSPTMLVKNCVDKLKDGTILNIISNASDLAMTNSLVYNGSKGAMKIITKQMARELSKTHSITVFGVSPAKIADTTMSRYVDSKVCDLRGWTEAESKAYQFKNMLVDEEINKNILGEFIVFLLSNKQRHKFLQGCIIPYGSPSI